MGETPSDESDGVSASLLQVGGLPQRRFTLNLTVSSLPLIESEPR